MMVYDLGIFLWALVSLPKLFQKKMRGTILARLFGPKVKRIDNEVVWFHAVSLGESNAAIPLVKKTRQDHPDAYIVFSCTTKTAYDNVAKKLPEVDEQLFLPLDFKWVMRRMMRIYRPKRVFVLESEFWYNFLNEAKKVGAQLILANGKISDRSFERFYRFKGISRQLFKLFDVACAQTEGYAEKLTQLGANAHAVGNLKFDVEKKHLSNGEILKFKEQAGIAQEEKVILIASSHPGEEEMLVKALETTEGRILIAPRHPERFEEVHTTLDSEYLNEAKGKRIIIVNKMGILDLCYQMADAVIMAGSFTGKVGGHNILEPIEFDKLTLFGPYMYSQKQMCEDVLMYQAGYQVKPEQIAKVLKDFFDSEAKRKSVMLQSKKLKANVKGATMRTFALI